MNSELVNCSNCKTNLRIEEIEREAEKYELFDEKPSRFELWLNSLKESSNPFTVAIYTVLKLFYLIYMGIVGFVVWSVLWFSG